MSEFNAEEMRKIIERVEKEKSIDRIYERFMNDVGEYLHEKFPMEPLDAIGEAAVYIGQRAIIMNQDALFMRDREWHKSVVTYTRKEIIERNRELNEELKLKLSMEELAKIIDNEHKKYKEEVSERK